MFIFWTLGVLWFIRTTKAVLFWIYLWQLKDYHIGRFIDHFRTAKGKTLFFNPLFFVKIILFLISLSLPWQDYGDGFVFILIALYGGEAMLAGRAFFARKLLKPVFTPKTSFLVFQGIVGALVFLLLVFLFFKRVSLSLLLAFDILVPVVISLNVLSLQPLVALFRNRIIARARAKRETLTHLKVIGITGSYGKTTTKEFLAHILSKKFKVLKTKEHQNSEVGVSQCILNELQPEHEVFVCEMGAYNRGGIKLLASIAQPKIAILTGANEQHLATFGSMENLLSAEGGKELIDSLPSDGVAIFNGDNKYAKHVYEETTLKQKILCNQNLAMAEFGLQADVWSENIRVEPERILFQVFSKDQEKVDFEVRVLGGYNVQNILLACAVAKELGMTLREIADACRTISQELGAMKLKKGSGGLTILDATYSANPDGVMAGLEYLKTWPGKKILVMPCLIELGKASKEVHKRIGEKIAEVCDLAIITTKDRFEDIVAGALLRPTFAKASAGMQGYGGREIQDDSLVFLENPQEIVEKIKSTTSAGDVVLLEGRVPSKLFELLT